MELLDLLQPKYAQYGILLTPTYQQGAEGLCQEGEQPRTLEENMKAFVNAYKSGDERMLSVFSNVWLNSCTAMANKANSTEFKLIPKSKQLLSDVFDNKFFLDVSYDSVQDGIALNTAQASYNKPLRETEASQHPFWQAAVDDKVLFTEFCGIVYHGFKKKTALGVYVREHAPEDRLHSVSLYVDGDFRADGTGSFGNYASFFTTPALAMKVVFDQANDKKHGNVSNGVDLQNTVGKQIQIALSRFDRHVSADQEGFQQDKQKAAKELLQIMFWHKK